MDGRHRARRPIHRRFHRAARSGVALQGVDHVAGPRRAEADVGAARGAVDRHDRRDRRRRRRRHRDRPLGRRDGDRGVRPTRRDDDRGVRRRRDRQHQPDPRARLRDADARHRDRADGHRQHAVALDLRASAGARSAPRRRRRSRPGPVDDPVGVGGDRGVRHPGRDRPRAVPRMGSRDGTRCGLVPDRVLGAGEPGRDHRRRRCDRRCRRRRPSRPPRRQARHHRCPRRRRAEKSRTVCFR